MSLKNSNNIKSYFLVALIIFGYAFIGYGLERTQFAALFLWYSMLFLATWKLVKINETQYTFLAGTALAIRLIIIMALPNLSQDYFRFIWDGRMILEGLNPYIYLPKDLISDPGLKLSQANELINGMGSLSASHYSNYPPINQMLFAIAGLSSNHSILGSVVIFRIMIIAADFGTLYFGSKLLERLGLEKHRIFWYLLNPLVIIELTGNLHFEGVMLFFFIWSLYLIHQKKYRLLQYRYWS